MKIIDGHMHINQWIRNDGKSYLDIIKDYQKANDISFLDNMCSSNNGKLWDGYEPDQSILGAIAKLESPDIFMHGCMYIPQKPDERKNFRFKDQLDELMEVGIDGVKICDFKPDSYRLFEVEKNIEEYDEYIGYCEKYDVHMCWHVADPEDFWDEDKVSDEIKRIGWFYGDKSFPTYESLYKLTYQLLDSHPKLNVLLAHAFFKSYSPDEVISILEKYPNVKIDFAPGWEMFDGFRTHYDKWYSIFRKYSDRFVFATDATMSVRSDYLNSLAQYILRFLTTEDEFDVHGNHRAKGIALEQSHLENILYKNHENTVGKSPKEINKKALKKYVERYLPLMPDTQNKLLTEEYYRKNLI